jgi:hypothetical protein
LKKNYSVIFAPKTGEQIFETENKGDFIFGLLTRKTTEKRRLKRDRR